MTLSTYSTGTVAVANGATVVIGAGTIWSGTNARAGDAVVIAGHEVTVLGVVDETHLTILPWPHSTVSAGSAYTIIQNIPARVVGAQAAADVAALITTLHGRTFFTVIGDEPTSDLGEEGQYALKTNGGAWKLWLKSGGAWVLQSQPVGLTYRGEWSSATAYVANDRVSRLGVSYTAKQPSTNVNPTTDSSYVYWDAGGAKGDKGDKGDFPIITVASASAVTVGNGAKTFLVSATAAFAPGMRLRAVNLAGDRVMLGLVASFTGTTLVLNVDTTQGVGSDTSWTISIAGEAGPAGPAGVKGDTGLKGDQGLKGDTGPASTVPGPKGETGAGLNWNASGTFAQRATYDGQTTGYAFLQTDVAPARLWIKASNTSADWAGPFYQGGTAAVGDWGLITDSVLDAYDYGSIAA